MSARHTPIAERLRARAFRLATRDFNGDGAKLAHDAADTIAELLEALEWIAANYENGHLNHVDFRVEAKHRADAAIAKATGAA